MFSVAQSDSCKGLEHCIKGDFYPLQLNFSGRGQFSARHDTWTPFVTEGVIH